MLKDNEREAIAALWARKLEQDALGLPLALRHRNLEPISAEFIHALAIGCGARRLLEIGGSSGLSTIALASAARETSGRLCSIEIVAARQEESRKRMSSLGLAQQVDFILADAAECLPGLGPFDFVLLDCEKADYVRFFDMLRLLAGALVVADNILSHDLRAYVSHVRGLPGLESLSLPIGKGLELSRILQG